MFERVHCCLAACLLAASAVAAVSPPGFEVWGAETYTLEPGESVTFRVDFDQVPVRRWVLLVEGDVRQSHLNLRRVADGRLVHDQRDETRHEVSVPWGTGESLSAVLTAGRRGGAFAVSIWAPPRDAYLRAYSYEVNRALEALNDDRRGVARMHLQAALREDPDDAIARILVRGLESTGSATASAPDSTSGAAADPVRAAAAELRARGEPYAALDTLQTLLDRPLPVETLAAVYADLADLHLDIGNAAQARAAVAAAEALGLDGDALERLRRRLDP